MTKNPWSWKACKVSSRSHWRRSCETSSSASSTWLGGSCKQWLRAWLWKSERSFQDHEWKRPMRVLWIQMPNSHSEREWRPLSLWPQWLWHPRQSVGPHRRMSPSCLWMARVNSSFEGSDFTSLKQWSFTEKWPTRTQPKHIIVIGNIPLPGPVFRSWCLAITLGIMFWMWCDLWRFHDWIQFHLYAVYWK